MSETIPDRTITQRGFVIYDQFFDTTGNFVRVQQSSAATRPCCWIFSSTGGEAGEPNAAHLDLAQAERMRDALDQFIRETQETLQAESLTAADLDDRPEA